MPFSHLANTCSEVAVQFAMKKFFPDIEISFNSNEEANNDFQIPLYQVYKTIPGQNEILTQLQDKSGLEDMLRDNLKKDRIYCVRSGQNLGAGHFSFLRFEDGIWRFSTGPRRDIALTDEEGNVDQEVFESEFQILNSASCGIGGNLYSVRINEMNLPRAIAAMNYTAAFRAQAEDDGVEIAEAMVSGPFEVLIKDEDIFLHLTDEASNYWNLSKALNFSPEDELEFQSSVYSFQLTEHDQPKFLEKLAALDGFDIDHQDEGGKTLLHLAVQNKSTNAVYALLESGANDEIEDEDSHTAQDYLHEMEDTYSAAELLPLKRCFQLVSIKKAIATRPNDLTELHRLMSEAGSYNNYAGMKLLIDAGVKCPGALYPSSDALEPLTGLLETRKTSGASWSTIEESLFLLLDKVLEADEDAATRVIDSLLANGLKVNFQVYAKGEWKGQTLSLLATKHGRQNIVKKLKQLDDESAAQPDSDDDIIAAFSESYTFFEYSTVKGILTNELDTSLEQILAQFEQERKKMTNPALLDTELGRLFQKTLTNENLSSQAKKEIKKLLTEHPLLQAESDEEEVAIDAPSLDSFGQDKDKIKEIVERQVGRFLQGSIPDYRESSLDVFFWDTMPHRQTDSEKNKALVEYLFWTLDNNNELTQSLRAEAVAVVAGYKSLKSYIPGVEHEVVDDDTLIQELKDLYAVFSLQISITENDRLDLAEANATLAQVCDMRAALATQVSNKDKLDDKFKVLLQGSINNDDVFEKFKPHLKSKYNTLFPKVTPKVNAGSSKLSATAKSSGHLRPKDSPIYKGANSQKKNPEPGVGKAAVLEKNDAKLIKENMSTFLRAKNDDDRSDALMNIVALQNHGQPELNKAIVSTCYSHLIHSHPKADEQFLFIRAYLENEHWLSPYVEQCERKEAIRELNLLLDGYLTDRREAPGNAPPEKYFWGSLFGGGFTLTQKESAVEALKDALAGNQVDLDKHKGALRDGKLGATLRHFIRTAFPAREIRPQVTSIVTDPSGNRVRDFLDDLTNYNLNLDPEADNKSVNSNNS